MYLHAQCRLKDQRRKGHEVHARVMFRDVHDDLKKQGSERDTGAVTPVSQNREKGDDSKDNCSGCMRDRIRKTAATREKIKSLQ